MKNKPHGLETALDVFIGYVMLDAWIANQDRHHENWGAIQIGDIYRIIHKANPQVVNWEQGGRLRLAPTFDHGAALARNLLDEERNKRLNTRDRNFTIEYFVRRAKSAFYHQETDSKTLGTFEAFAEFASHSEKAAQIWLKQLERIKRDDIEIVINNVPDTRMTGIAKRFTLELLLANQKVLLHKDE
jgi:hypothetical protein